MTGTASRPAVGLDNVVAPRTRLSHVDGLAGQLYIAGYPLEEIAGRLTFEETALLLWKGALPGKQELARVSAQMAELRALPALGLEPRSFVAMFACDRVAGWCAHVIEQHAEDHLIRPQSEYTGPKGLRLER